MSRMNTPLATLLLVCCAPSAGASPEGHPASAPFTLKEAVEYVLARHPAVRASESEASAAGSARALARTAYLPRADLLLQANRASRNNVFGMLLPQPVIPAISGPVLDETTSAGTWGSGLGALFSWEPFDFGLRRANVEAASAVQAQAASRLALTRFQVGVEVAASFLRLLVAEEAVRAAQANVERAQVFADSVAALVRSELRPGADESRALAELARARIELIRAEQSAAVSRATLAEWMALPSAEIRTDPGRLLEIPEMPPAPGPLSSHPVADLQRSAAEVPRARERALERAYYPRFNLQLAYYGRGTGALTDGSFESGLDGLALDVSNWGAGLTLTFPVFDLASIRARKEIEAANGRAEAARYDQRLQELSGQLERARALVEGARRIAENTPIQLQAARTLEQQAAARYQAGLATVIEVAEAQRLLTQSEIEDALARLGVWQALLGEALAEGDLGPVLEQASR